jgi:hypothetical protein
VIAAQRVASYRIAMIAPDSRNGHPVAGSTGPGVQAQSCRCPQRHRGHESAGTGSL